MKKVMLFAIFIYSSFVIHGQIEPILVSEQTIKVGNEKDLFLAFAEGDEIIFDLELIKGKHLKEVEILEYPHASKYFDYKTKRINDKRIAVNKNAIYQFRIKGGGVGAKICKVRIFRIPASEETISFDTGIKWKVRLDSTYVTRYTKELVEVDTNAVVVMDRVERVHSKTHLENPNVTSFNVQLPNNETTELRTSELVSWAYWIGVGNEGLEAYEKDKKDFLLEHTSTASAMIDPIAGLALGAYAMLSNPPSGDNVKYQMVTYFNGITKTLASGNSVTANGRVTDMKQGGFAITLENDNIMDGINVSIKITAIVVNKKYQNKPYQKLMVKQHRYPIMSTAD